MVDSLEAHRNDPLTAPAKLLLVDDHPENLLALQSLLEDVDQRLVLARTAEEALQKLLQSEFALILMDVDLPGMDGFEAAKLIREHWRFSHTPIIFLTAHDLGRTEIEKGYLLGAVDFLVKPLVPVAIKAKVTSFLDLFNEKQKAKQEADQFRSLIQGATEYAIFLLDSYGVIKTWNPGAERIKGYRAEEIIGQHFSIFYPAEARQRNWPSHELEIATAEGRFEDEGWRLRKDGSQFWANVVITAIKDEAGRLKGFSKLTRDLTEKKLAEENQRRLLQEEAARQVAEQDAKIIQEQQERLRVTLASIGDAVISTDAEGKITFLNAVAEELTAWTSQEAIGVPLTKVFHIINETTRNEVENPALRALKEGVIVGLANHTVLIDKAGMELPIDDSAAPIRDAEGQTIGAILVFRDITEKHRAEVALIESEARNRAIVETALDCIITIDHEGRVLEFNPAAEATFGYRRGDIFGKHLCDLIIPEELRQKHIDGLKHYLVTGEGPVLNQRLEMPARRSDGSALRVELAISRLKLDGPPQFTAYLREVGQKK